MVVVEGDKEDRVHDGEDHGREQGASQDELEPGVRDGVLGLARANTNLKNRGERLDLVFCKLELKEKLQCNATGFYQ